MCVESNTKVVQVSEDKFVNIDLKSESGSDTGQSETSSRKSWVQYLIPKKTAESWTEHQILICLIFAVVQFFAATVISIQAPFFPQVAAGKGATSIEYGFVFGVFELIVFIMSPVFGAKINQWNPRTLFTYGVFTTSSCCFVFGFLDLLDNRVVFITSCFVVRIVEAVGDAAFVVASFTIVANEFPNSVATTFGIMETFYGLGMIAGPTLGGALYEAGGYTLPFTTMGGLLFVAACISYRLLPPRKEGQDVQTNSGFATFRLLKFPSVLITAYSIVATACGVGYLHSTLEREIDSIQPGLSKLVVGAIFILNGGVYALTAPTWGKLCDKFKKPKYFVIIGSVCTIVGFIILAPMIPIERSLWNVCVGLVLFGLGLGSILVSAFIQAMDDTFALGYPDDVGTYGLVSGLWTSMLALGFFVGASSGGVLASSVGFRLGCLSIVGTQLLLILMIVILTWSQRGSPQQHTSPTSTANNLAVGSLPSTIQQSQDILQLQSKQTNKELNLQIAYL